MYIINCIYICMYIYIYALPRFFSDLLFSRLSEKRSKYLFAVAMRRCNTIQSFCKHCYYFQWLTFLSTFRKTFKITSLWSQWVGAMIYAASENTATIYYNKNPLYLPRQSPAGILSTKTPVHSTITFSRTKAGQR